MPRRSPGAKAQNLLRRFPFTDLAIAVARRGERRAAYLERFVRGGTNASYRWMRAAVPEIYSVQGQLIPVAPAPWEQIKSKLEKDTPPENVDRNVGAATELFDLVRPRGYRAFSIDPQDLRVSLLQRVPIGLNYYLVEGDRLLFQYAQPRRAAQFNDDVLSTMGSIIHHAYAFGDYAAAEIEIADLSIPEGGSAREARIRPVRRSDILGRDELNQEIEAVYALLQEIAERPPDNGGPGDLGL